MIRWSLSVIWAASISSKFSMSRVISELHYMSSIWLAEFGPYQVGSFMSWKESRLVALAKFRSWKSLKFLSLLWFALKSPRIIVFQFLFFASRNQAKTFSWVFLCRLGWLACDGMYTDIMRDLFEGKLKSIYIAEPGRASMLCMYGCNSLQTIIAVPRLVSLCWEVYGTKFDEYIKYKGLERFFDLLSVSFVSVIAIMWKFDLAQYSSQFCIFSGCDIPRIL